MGCYSDPSPNQQGSRDGSAWQRGWGALKMLSLLLVDLMNGLWDLKAPSALAGNLPAFPSHLLDKCIGELWFLCLLWFLLETRVPSPQPCPHNLVTEDSELQLLALHMQVAAPDVPCLQDLRSVPFHRWVQQDLGKLTDLPAIT